jgi:hypothetical protein
MSLKPIKLKKSVAVKAKKCHNCGEDPVKGMKVSAKAKKEKAPKPLTLKQAKEEVLKSIEKMNHEVRDKWTTALRSGKYKQTTGTLARQDDNGKRTFCCLGVLTDLYLKEKELSWDDDNGGYASTLSYEGDCSTLPCAVQDWAGLKTENPEVLFVNGDAEEDEKTDREFLACDLAEINDEHECGFKKIATLIEKSL